MTEVKHTPLPWDQSHRDTGNGMYSTEIYDISGEAIAVLTWYPVRTESSTTTSREANASFIVRACNSHYELLETLKDMVEEGWTGGMSSGAYSSTEQGALDRARAAIKLATP